MSDLRVFKTGDQWWACDAYDHGPMCRLCTPIPASVGEHMSQPVRLGPEDTLVFIAKPGVTLEDMEHLSQDIAAAGLDHKVLIVPGEGFDVKVVPGA